MTIVSKVWIDFIVAIDTPAQPKDMIVKKSENKD